MNKFETTINVRWSDVDQNRHVRHSAYYDYAAHVRILLLNGAGFGSEKFRELNFGPILFKEECSFIREIHPNDTIRVNMLKGDIAPDCSKWTIHHEIHNQHNVKAAHITVKGAWLDMNKRRLMIPPKELAELFNNLCSGEDFVYKKI